MGFFLHRYIIADRYTPSTGPEVTTTLSGEALSWEVLSNTENDRLYPTEGRLIDLSLVLRAAQNAPVCPAPLYLCLSPMAPGTPSAAPEPERITGCLPRQPHRSRRLSLSSRYLTP